MVKTALPPTPQKIITQVHFITAAFKPAPPWSTPQAKVSKGQRRKYPQCCFSISFINTEGAIEYFLREPIFVPSITSRASKAKPESYSLVCNCPSHELTQDFPSVLSSPSLPLSLGCAPPGEASVLAPTLVESSVLPTPETDSLCPVAAYKAAMQINEEWPIGRTAVPTATLS